MYHKDRILLYTTIGIFGGILIYNQLARYFDSSVGSIIWLFIFGVVGGAVGYSMAKTK